MHAVADPRAVANGSSTVGTGRPVPRGFARGFARGFTLIEVLIAMALLLVGGVSILSVFTLAVVHRVERDMEAKLDLLRPEARSLAQDAVDGTKAGSPPAPLVNVPTSQTGFTLSVTFVRSPNGDPAWVAQCVLSYRGQELRQGRLPPIWLTRSTLDLR